MITMNGNTFYQEDTPVILLSGEVHYFRLNQEQWYNRLQQLKDTGCNTVATYVPWVYHQEIESECDFTGKTTPRKNLITFLEYCKELDLLVILRPGPYVMAELKNEGIPYWMYEKHPYAKSKTWGNRFVTSPVFDVLHPSFLEEVRKWYRKLYTVIKPFLQQFGGPVFGLQLDNEVGMLSWVTNSPELNEDVTNELSKNFPTSNEDFTSDKQALAYHNELTNVMRLRYKSYIETLQSYWTSFGVKDVLYFINIHGTSHGRAKTFPIGIQQLLLTYDKNDIVAGSDIYLDDIDLETAHDLYIVNEMLLSTSPTKPMTSLEFNTSDGNFGDNLHKRTLPSSIDFSVRLSILQNHRLINYYLFTGGYNDRFKHLSDIDGNDRIAITGERHGFAAPVQADGSTLYTYPKLQYVTTMVANLSTLLAQMNHQPDSLFVGFNPNDYATEYQLEGSKLWKDVNEHLEFHRQSTLWDTILKQSLLLQYRFQYYRLDNSKKIDPNKVPHLIMNTSKYLSSDIQRKLIEYHKSGGFLMLVGEYPELDEYGNDCTTLVDYFKIRPKVMYYDWEYPLLSLISKRPINGTQEFRSFYAQTCESSMTPLFTEYQTGDSVGVISDRLIYVTSQYPGDLSFTKYLFEILQVKPRLQIRSDDGMIISSIQSGDPGSFLHVLNLDHVDHQIDIILDGKPLFPTKISLYSQDAYMIPLDLTLPCCLIHKSTAEVYDMTDTSLTLRLTQPEDTIILSTDLDIIESEDYRIYREDDRYILISNHHAKIHQLITIRFSNSV